MFVKMIVRPEDESWNDEWSEEFDSNNTRCLRHYDDSLTAQEYGEAVIMFFNNTLKPGERRRKLIEAKQISSLTGRG